MCILNVITEIQTYKVVVEQRHESEIPFSVFSLSLFTFVLYLLLLTNAFRTPDLDRFNYQMPFLFEFKACWRGQKRQHISCSSVLSPVP